MRQAIAASLGDRSVVAKELDDEDEHLQRVLDASFADDQASHQEDEDLQRALAASLAEAEELQEEEKWLQEEEGLLQEEEDVLQEEEEESLQQVLDR